MAFLFFASPKEKATKAILSKKPNLLMHTSNVVPNKMYGLKPAFNKSKNQSYVFGTDDEKLASIYLLQPFFEFTFSNGEHAVIITGSNHDLLTIDNKVAYIYFIDSKNFSPNVSENGTFSHEWMSQCNEYIRKDVEPKKITFNDILRMGVQVFWISNLNTLVEIDKEMASSGMVTGEQKIQYLKEQTNWKPDKVMYINQFRNICPIKINDKGLIEIDYNKQVGYNNN